MIGDLCGRHPITLGADTGVDYRMDEELAFSRRGAVQLICVVGLACDVGDVTPTP